jgi:hypothetical protein
MYDDLERKVMALMGHPAAIAASAPTPEPAADDFSHFMFLLGGPFRRFGKRPPTGDFDLPPAAGSASDIQNAHKGCAAQKGGWQ